MPDVKQLIVDYLKEATLMQLATSVNAQPWVCNVWFAADEELNIYWLSIKDRRHSKEVLQNNKVAGTVALPIFKPVDKPRCVQFQGVASVLTDQKDIDKAISVYADRIFTREKIKEFFATKPYAFYKIKPSLFVLFDSVNFPDDPRKEMTI
jgi:uncharacterized protein YhbP (UPF0306 family)